MAPAKPVRPHVPPSAAPEVVDPRWILKAAGAVVALGLLCSYITLCAFFYNGQWQFVLHPSRTLAATPASQGLAFTPVRFGDDLAGHPELSGWWVPGDEQADPVVLLLHGENGDMSDAVPYIAALHAARVNVLAFDYRGYGQSAGQHPTEARMQVDAGRALGYLLETRHIARSRIVVAGQGLAAALAVQLCRKHPDLPTLILLDADGDTLSRVQADQRSRIVPVSWLFHERFPLADVLRSLPTPKLLISFTRGDAPLIAQRAADPKTTAELPPNQGVAGITPVVRRFLGTYMVTTIPALTTGKPQQQ